LEARFDAADTNGDGDPPPAVTSQVVWLGSSRVALPASTPGVLSREEYERAFGGGSDEGASDSAAEEDPGVEERQAPRSPSEELWATVVESALEEGDAVEQRSPSIADRPRIVNGVPR
jgi:hypothetical protein